MNKKLLILASAGLLLCAPFFGFSVFGDNPILNTPNEPSQQQMVPQPTANDNSDISTPSASDENAVPQPSSNENDSQANPKLAISPTNTNINPSGTDNGLPGNFPNNDANQPDQFFADNTLQQPAADTNDTNQTQTDTSIPQPANANVPNNAESGQPPASQPPPQLAISDTNTMNAPAMDQTSKNFTQNDDQLTIAVKQAFDADKDLSALAPNINISSNNGVVTLSGSVDNFRHKHQFKEKAMGVSGVKSVINNIRVNK